VTEEVKKKVHNLHGAKIKFKEVSI